MRVLGPTPQSNKSWRAKPPALEDELAFIDKQWPAEPLLDPWGKQMTSAFCLAPTLNSRQQAKRGASR